MKKITESDAQQLTAKYYGIEGSIKQLNGEIDLNFCIQSADDKKYILKIANPKESLQQLALQNAMMTHLKTSGGGLDIQQVISSLQGEEIVSLRWETETRLMRLLTWIEGSVFAEVNPHAPTLLYKLGEMCGRVSKGLAGFDHAGAHRFMKWDPSQATWVNDHLRIFVGEKKEMVLYGYNLFSTIQPALQALRKSVNYNDANDYNVLVQGVGEQVSVPGVIDFGDAVYTNTINELAVALAYAIMHKPDPIEAAIPVIRGYHSQFPLLENELEVLFPLIVTRLVISVTCSALNLKENPNNQYLQISDAPAWELLKKLRQIPPALALYKFRDACDLEPCTKNSVFKQWATKHYPAVQFPVPKDKNLHWLDLSVGSLDMGNSDTLNNPVLLNSIIRQQMDEADASIAFGRYNEARAFYSSSLFHEKGNDAAYERTIHIGMDFFAHEGTAVMAALDGTVFSSFDNTGDCNYGPTIILKHDVSNDLSFYTLYGHLSRNSLTNLKAGDVVKKDSVLGHVGAIHENGNWPPHLHFQVILDILDAATDFPGVAAAHQRKLWQSISPDPWILLTGAASESQVTLSKQEIVTYRQQHLGKNMSISYREPIKVVRGQGCYLLDDTGRKYLDTVNNVAHVGHEHPRVVRAGQRQMAVLNTNTRYLHENLVTFTQAILETMPSSLSVAFVVNSGSEANELGMRLAKNYTNQKDMIVSEVGYHGNTNGCIEISSYKFDGPGGRGVSPYVHVIPIPDVYRGLYRADDPHAGSKYASHVDQAIRKMQSEGRNPAAFIFESVISCGGQVELPANFLKEAYQLVRKAGGVCLADEVQTGCGRAGENFWAFQAHDVVPDIVTIGKPIGNGHPLAVVVTTQAIADAFKNGMEYFNTFGGNPVSCAIGTEVLRVIKDEGLQQNASVVGGYLKDGLRNMMNDFEIIGDVRGPGLFIGFELVSDRKDKIPATVQASYFANRMRDKGILMSTDGPYNNVLKIKPPLVFSRSNADFLLESIQSVLKEDFMKI